MILHTNQSHRLLDELSREFFNAMYPANCEKEACESVSWCPAMDVQESTEQFTLVADLPGVDPDSIEISIEQNRLSLKGERVLSGDKTARRERKEGKFYREFKLPQTVASDKVSAHSQHGVLTIVIPKQEQAKPRNISVSVQS